MKKLIGIAFGLIVGLLWVQAASAANYAIAPKDTVCFGYSTTVSTVAIGPGALYEITLSSGASGEYVILSDSSTYLGLTLNGMRTAGNPTQIAPPAFFGSTTANTQIRFDPPLHFFNGLYAADSAATGAACYTYELGRGLSGN